MDDVLYSDTTDRDGNRVTVTVSPEVAERLRREGVSSGDLNMATAGQLKSVIERIERLEEERKALSDDIRDVYAESKGTGFDTVILRKIIALRKQDLSERQEQDALLESYMAALGMSF